jgi:hypothetical protein
VFTEDSTGNKPLSFREIASPKNKGLNENPTYGSGSSLRTGVLLFMGVLSDADDVVLRGILKSDGLSGTTREIEMLASSKLYLQ